MSAGRGFEYLLKSIAAGDGDRNFGIPLTRYYTAEGTPPGTWLGSGLSGLGSDEVGRIAAGDVVSEVQLSRLLGEGVDPVTGERLGLGYGRYATRRQRVASRTATPNRVRACDATSRSLRSVPRCRNRPRVSRLRGSISRSHRPRA
jgi:hypothetical protein